MQISKALEQIPMKLNSIADGNRRNLNIQQTNFVPEAILRKASALPG